MKKILIPMAVYICFLVIYIGISKYNNNDYLFQPIWDVEHYLTISETGYEVFPCTPGVNGPPGAICGNPGWFPMWPFVVKAVRPILGGNSKYSFVGLSLFFTLLAFILIFKFLDIRFGAKAAFFGLLAMAFGPAGFYWMTGFPYALFAVLFMLYLIILYSNNGKTREFGLFAVALMLSLCYPTGMLIAIVPLVWKINRNKNNGISPNTLIYWLKILRYLIPFALGVLILWTYFYYKFDDFFLQIHFQEKYQRTLAFPFWIMLKSLFTESPLTPENITILWYGLIFLVFYPYKLSKELWITALALYLFSLTTGSTMSIYRHYLIILPSYMLIGVSPRPIWLKGLFIALGLLAALTVMFPRFMAYRLM